jgi:hypothetical protein
MSNFLPCGPSFSEPWQTQEPFELVIAYQDVDAREQASRLCARLEAQVGGQNQFQISWWDLDDFGNSLILNEAAATTARADMVIVALSSADTLPEHAHEWIASWVSRKEEGKSALVALINKNPESLQSAWTVRAFLQNVARQACMDFFYHAAESTPDLPCSLFNARRTELITPRMRRAAVSSRGN